MPLVNFHVSHFRRKARNGRFDLDITWPELVHAAITVGKWRDDLYGHGCYSAFEAASRANLLWAYLRQSPSGHYVRTAAYDELDATEKSGVSYTLGMTIAKVFATRELSVPWLMHLDRYRDVFGVQLPGGRSRPDLVGPRDVNAQLDWLVAEAKGRSHNLKSDDAAKMRAQKQRVLTIGGQAPYLYIGAAAHFTSDALDCRVVDPPSRGSRHELFVNVDDVKRGFVQAYYGPFLDLLGETGVSTDGYARRRIAEADLAVGISGRRVESLRRYLDGETDDTGLAPGGDDEHGRIINGFVGGDAIRIDLGPSWTDEAMVYEPRERASNEDPDLDQRA